MSYKDPAKQAEYQRNWQRVHRVKNPNRTLNQLKVVCPEQIKRASELLLVLSELIKGVVTTDRGDIFMRSRTAGYLISIGLRAIEVSDIEARIEALEKQLREKTGRAA